MARRDRYKEFEAKMTAALLGNTLLFIAYLIAAGAGILWLKILLAVFTLLIPVGALLLLYLSRELLRQRSLWLSCGFFAIAMCTLVSLILAFP